MGGNIFGGNGFFGKPVPLARPVGQGPVQIVQPGQVPAQQPALGVVPPAPQQAMGPQGPVPMGQKKDCPVCR